MKNRILIGDIIPTNYLDEYVIHNYGLHHIFIENLDGKDGRYRDFYSTAKDKIIVSSSRNTEDAEKQIEIAEDINADYLIAPFEYRNTGKTCKKVQNYLRISKKLRAGIKIAGVIQGNTYRQIEKCFLNFIEMGIKFIIFSNTIKVDCTEECNIKITNNELYNRSLYRVSVIQNLFNNGAIPNNIWIHLYEMNHINEFINYINMEQVRSISTCIPFVSGVFEIDILRNIFTNEQFKTKINMDMDEELDELQHKLIVRNIESLYSMANIWRN